MKIHVSIDEENGIIHSVSITAANEHDVTEVANLLHSEEDTAWGDTNYLGEEKKSKHRDVV